MTASNLKRSVTRGKLWGAAYTWSEAIKNHAEPSHDGCCRFIVTMNGPGSKATAGVLLTPRNHDIRFLVVSINLAPLRAPFLVVSD